MYGDRSLARKVITSAISSDRPIRPVGVEDRVSCSTSAPLAHGADSGTHAEPDARLVDTDQPIPPLDGLRLNVWEGPDAGVVDKDVQGLPNSYVTTRRATSWAVRPRGKVTSGPFIRVGRAR